MKVLENLIYEITDFEDPTNRSDDFENSNSTKLMVLEILVVKLMNLKILVIDRNQGFEGPTCQFSGFKDPSFRIDDFKDCACRVQIIK